MPLLMWILAGLGSILSGVVGQLTVATAKIVMIRGLILFCVYVALPIVLFNVLLKFHIGIFNYLIDYLLVNLPADTFSYSLTGVGAYLFNEFQIAAGFSLLLSAYALRFIISIIKR